MMDDMGIWAQICFQNSGVTQPAALVLTGDNDFADTVIRIYNDASAEYQAESDQRVFNMAHLPYWDQTLMVAEARRCIDLGLKGFVLPDKPEMMDSTCRASRRHWAPVLEMCNDTGMPINFPHQRGDRSGQVVWEGFPFQQKLSIYPMLARWPAPRRWATGWSRACSTSYPKLKIGLIEAGLGWVPFVLEMLEHQFDEMLPGHALPAEAPVGIFPRPISGPLSGSRRLARKPSSISSGSTRFCSKPIFRTPPASIPTCRTRLVEALGDHCPTRCARRCCRTTRRRCITCRFKRASQGASDHPELPHFPNCADVR